MALTTNMSNEPHPVKVAPHTSNRECYHAPDCHKVKENYTSFPKGRVERAGLRPCKYCLGEIDYEKQKNPNRSYYQYALKAE